MKKIRLKTPAKINLTLDVLGVDKRGFHQISSLVTSIDLYDYISISKRKDGAVKLACKGLDVGCEIEKNNAYKSALSFVNEFKTNGANIAVDKRIPVGAGLGGSSADTAGVLNGLKALYGVSDSVKALADGLGSDTSYMLKGGYAVISGRGDEQEFLDIDKTLYLVILVENEGVSAKQSYAEFDELNKTYPPCTDNALTALKKADFNSFCELAKNDLYLGSKKVLPQIENNVKALKEAGAPLALMTGSGSAVIGVFENKKDRDKVYKKLKPVYKKNIIKCKTI